MSNFVCPYWMGYLLISPLRRLIQNPERILSPYVAAGMTVLEVGPGMGFFTLPMAKMVGPNGKILCVDVQEKMLRSFQRRALKSGLVERIITRVCGPTSLSIGDFDGKIDFALAFAVVHEVPDMSRLFAEIVRALKPGAKCLIAEPRLHVSAQKFEQTVASAKEQGLKPLERPILTGSHAVLMDRA